MRGREQGERRAWREALDRLAALVEGGEHMAGENPAALLRAVADELERVRRRGASVSADGEVEAFAAIAAARRWYRLEEWVRDDPRRRVLLDHGGIWMHGQDIEGTWVTLAHAKDTHDAVECLNQLADEDSGSGSGPGSGSG
jgi:hypothetical protein